MCIGTGGNQWPVFNQSIQEFQISALPALPTVLRGVFQRIGHHALAKRAVLENFDDGFGERVRVSRFKKADDGVVKLIQVNLRVRHHQRHAQGHELHDFCAVGLVAE